MYVRYVKQHTVPTLRPWRTHFYVSMYQEMVDLTHPLFSVCKASIGLAWLDALTILVVLLVVSKATMHESLLLLKGTPVVTHFAN